MHPLLRGRDIEAWDAQPSGYILVPQDPKELKVALTEEEVRRRYPEALKWLQAHATILRTRSAPNKSWHINGADWFRLQGSFEYMTYSYMVVVPEQRMPPPAAVIEATYNFSLGRKAIAIPNHKVVFCSVPTLGEALYLTAAINSTQMQSLLASFASQTAVSPTTLARLPIPPFDINSLNVQNIVAAAKVIHTASDKREARINQGARIDDEVEVMLGLAGITEGARAVALPARQRTPRRASTPTTTELRLFD